MPATRAQAEMLRRAIDGFRKEVEAAPDLFPNEQGLLLNELSCYAISEVSRLFNTYAQKTLKESVLYDLKRAHGMQVVTRHIGAQLAAYEAKMRLYATWRTVIGCFGGEEKAIALLQ